MIIYSWTVHQIILPFFNQANFKYRVIISLNLCRSELPFGLYIDTLNTITFSCNVQCCTWMLWNNNLFLKYSAWNLSNIVEKNLSSITRCKHLRMELHVFRFVLIISYRGTKEISLIYGCNGDGVQYPSYKEYSETKWDWFLRHR